MTSQGGSSARCFWTNSEIQNKLFVFFISIQQQAKRNKENKGVTIFGLDNSKHFIYIVIHKGRCHLQNVTLTNVIINCFELIFIKQQTDG